MVCGLAGGPRGPLRKHPPPPKQTQPAGRHAPALSPTLAPPLPSQGEVLVLDVGSLKPAAANIANIANPAQCCDAW